MKVKKHLFIVLLTMTLLFATAITALAATKTVYMNLADARAKLAGEVVWQPILKPFNKDTATGAIVVDNISNNPEEADIVDRLELEIKAYNNGKVKKQKTVTDLDCFDVEGVVTEYADEFKFNGKMENNGKTITDTVWIWK